jgi:phospholipase/lecithinase/hemolysin
MGLAYERTPQVMNDSNNATRIPAEKKAYEALNSGITNKLDAFRTSHPDSKSVLIDTAPIFNEALDDPSKIGMKDATCWGGPPEQGCVWADDFHPGPALHRWIASHVAALGGRIFDDFMHVVTGDEEI